MNYEELDPVKPRGAELPQDEDDQDIGPPAGRARVTVSLSWQQVGLIIGVNAIISLIISLVVVIVAGRSMPAEPGAMVAATAPLAAAGNTVQAQPPLSHTPASLPGVIATPGEPAANQSTPAPPTPVVYIVQPGDTLSSIAGKYNVSLEDLMRANDIANPDYVQLGQELIVPVGGLPAATPTSAPVPSPTDTPLPFNPPTQLPLGSTPPPEPAATVGPPATAVPTLTSAPASQVRLALQVLNPGDPAKETVQIVNQGPFVRLTGWTLSNEEGNVYTFPDFSLWGGGAINIHTASGPNTITDLYWGQPQAMWVPGETATLKDSGGKVIATLTVAAQ